MTKASRRLMLCAAIASTGTACTRTTPAPQPMAVTPVDFALTQMAAKGERREHRAEERAVTAYRACLRKSVAVLARTAESADAVADAAFARCIPSGLAATHADPFVPPGAEEQALAILNVSTRGFVTDEVARDRAPSAATATPAR